MSERTNLQLWRFAGALGVLVAVAALTWSASSAGFVWPSIEALTRIGVPSTTLVLFGLMAGQLAMVLALMRLHTAIKNQPAPPPLHAPVEQREELPTEPSEDQIETVLPRTPQNIALELAVMSDSVQRFLVWMRAHGMSGEQVWSRLQMLYEEFCQMTGDEPEDMRVLGKRLLQCGCEKPPMKNTLVNGKRVRKQFYIIPERSIEPSVTLAGQQEEDRDEPPSTLKLAA